MSSRSRERLCLLIADDLTGAADACVKFVTRGFTGTVALTLDAARDATVADADAGAATDSDVLAINADTRRRSEEVARRRVREAGRLYAAMSMPRPVAIFKKIDSTLRGHVAAEIAEALRAFDRTHAIMTPAFPAMGRTVRDGALIVDERVVCDVRALLAKEGIGHEAASIAATDLQTEAAAVAAFARARVTGARVFVCDAASQADLDTIAAADMALDAGGGRGRTLWVGSAGLADALAARLAARRAAAPPSASPLPLPLPRAIRDGGRSVILFVGSKHPVTREQRERLRDALDRRRPRESQRHVLVSSDVDHVSNHVTFAAADRARTAGFVMTGGDTAADVCRVLGAMHLQLGGEVEQGVPWGVLRGGIADGLPMVLKSGAFGTPDTLVRALDFLEALDARP